jgi:hypothetical protein
MMPGVAYLAVFPICSGPELQSNRLLDGGMHFGTVAKLWLDFVALISNTGVRI